MKAVKLEALQELVEAVEGLDLRPRHKGHAVRHLDGCAAVTFGYIEGEPYGTECNCGMVQVWMARLALKEGL